MLGRSPQQQLSNWTFCCPETKTQPSPLVIGHPGPNTTLHFGAFCVALRCSQEALCSGKSLEEEGYEQELEVCLIHKCSYKELIVCASSSGALMGPAVSLFRKTFQEVVRIFEFLNIGILWGKERRKQNR